METLKKITNFVSKYMAVIVIAVAALAHGKLHQNQLRKHSAWNRNVRYGTYPEAK